MKKGSQGVGDIILIGFGTSNCIVRNFSTMIIVKVVSDLFIFVFFVTILWIFG